MSTTITNYRKLSNVQVIAALTGREVFYLAMNSKTNASLERHFKITQVEFVGISAKTGIRYVTARVIDHDNGDIETCKNLHLETLDILS
jgi:hypothetical protein